MFWSYCHMAILPNVPVPQGEARLPGLAGGRDLRDFQSKTDDFWRNRGRTGSVNPIPDQGDTRRRAIVKAVNPSLRAIIADTARLAIS
jgi:hypothetical protein